VPASVTAFATRRVTTTGATFTRCRGRWSGCLRLFLFL
jgi:hypothetical protein